MRDSTAASDATTSFLFWNVMKRDLRPLIVQAVLEREVHVLLLAESPSPDADVVAALHAATGSELVALSEADDPVRLISRLPSESWTRRQADHLFARMSIWSLRAGGLPDVLLVTTHFVSKANASDSDQALLAAVFSLEIQRVEDHLGHQRTLVVGDLNMNPFEPGVASAIAQHAVMTRKLAAREERVVQGAHYRFFYNPMWGFFGDRTAGPPGTYYHRSARIGDLFWHMLDQVLLRPSLAEGLVDLKILDRIGETALLTSPAGLPCLNVGSDHLPIAFRLHLA